MDTFMCHLGSDGEGRWTRYSEDGTELESSTEPYDGLAGAIIAAHAVAKDGDHIYKILGYRDRPLEEVFVEVVEHE